MSLRERFHRDGVLHIPQLLSPPEMARLRAGYDWSMANPSPGAGWDQQGPKSFPLGQREGAVHRRLPLDQKPTSGASYSDNTTRRGMDVYGNVVVCPAILDVLSQLFSPAEELEAYFLGKQVFHKELGAPMTGWHQDVSDIGAEGRDMVGLWIPFTEVFPEGHPRANDARCLEFVRGSHVGPVYASSYGLHRGPGVPEVPDIEAARQDFDVVSWHCKPGDAIAFHFATLHGGGGVSPHHERRAIALRYFGPDCRVAERVVHLPAGQRQHNHMPKATRPRHPAEQAAEAATAGPKVGQPFRHPSYVPVQQLQGAGGRL